ncbi:hypothetical protein T07_13827 [Trichinella nelsoni]|uniref:Uncharacterized protein n=1 Tax=Trichinella nelsoni TaxID=6336 RepID=A0A0V0SH88_9BILA|nr:hypothetical protein T07_13827 [Trichinella nelsoni]
MTARPEALVEDSRTALYTLHGSICEKPLRSINSVASQYVHSVKASGRSERPSESSESSTVLYTVSEFVKLMNLGSASGPDGVKQDCNGWLSEETPLNPHQNAFQLGRDGVFDSISTFQSLFRRDPKRVAAHLIKNQPLSNVSFSIGVAESSLRQRLSQRPGTDAAPFKSKRPPNSENILSPISADEVTLHLKLMSAKTSAGLDGVQVSHLRQCDPVIVAPLSFPKPTIPAPTLKTTGP